MNSSLFILLPLIGSIIGAVIGAKAYANYNKNKKKYR